MSVTVQQAANDQAFVADAVEWIASRMYSSIEQSGCCIMGLSGGSTPKEIYATLGNRADIEWDKVYVFLVDERYVPHSDPRSNTRMLHETLLHGTPIPPSNVVVPDTELPIEQCMEKFATDLQTQWNQHLPHIMVLGIGVDGHIASLFPPLAPNLMDDTQLVAHTTTDQFDVVDRVGLTLNPIAAASHHLVLFGDEKKPTWDEMNASDDNESRWPLKRVLEQEDVMVLIGPQK